MNYTIVALWSQVASAALFLAVMVWIWMKYIQPAVLHAQESNNAQIATAERHRDEAKAQLELLRGEIENARRDAGAIAERAAAQAKREHEDALAEARESGERALRNAQEELSRARSAASVQLRDELLEKALAVARSDAAAAMNDHRNAQLLSSFLTALERGGQR